MPRKTKEEEELPEQETPQEPSPEIPAQEEVPTQPVFKQLASEAVRCPASPTYSHAHLLAGAGAGSGAVCPFCWQTISREDIPVTGNMTADFNWEETDPLAK